MMSNQTLCVICIALTILLIQLFDHIKDSRYHSHDSLVKFMLYISPERSELLWFSIWVVVYFAFGVILPFALTENNVTNGSSWFSKPNGLMITLNYVFIVPMLIGAYIGLVKQSNIFFAKKNLDDLGLRWTPKLRETNSRNLFLLISKVFLFFFTLLIINQAIGEIIATEKDIDSPWVDGKTLNHVGAIYYFLRGLCTYLALGLTLISIAIFCIFSFLLESDDVNKFLDSNFDVKASIRRLCEALCLCCFFGPLVTAVHGMAIINEAKEISQVENVNLSLLLTSTWLLWVMLTLVSTSFLLSGVFWFYTRLKDELAYVRNHMLQEIESLWESESRSIDSYSLKIDALEKVRNYLDLVQATPVPRNTLLVFVASFLIQILNIAAVVFSLK